MNPRNFYEQFAAAAEQFAGCTAVELQRRDAVDRFTYAELRALAERAASFLAARGVRPGDRVAILADNDARWCAAYLGTLRLGGVAVPLDTAYKPKQIAALVRDSEAAILFTTPRYLPAARKGAALAGAATELVLLEGRDPQSASFDDLPPEPRSDATPLRPCPAGQTDPAVILYTSGTTSDPKGVVLVHGNLLAERDLALRVVRVDEHDCILGVLPLFHALAQMANLLLPFSIGARVVFLEAVNSAELLRALRERGVTAFCCVPQFFYLIHQRVTQEVAAGGRIRRMAFRAMLGLNGWLRQMNLNLGPLLFRRVHDVLGPQMRLLVTGGSRFDPAIGRDLYRLGFSLLQAYGLTESSGAATVTHPGGKYADSVGPPLPGVEVKIAPSAVARGEAVTQPASENDRRDGEVLIRGPIVMQGYFNRPDATAAALEDGWLHTGDLGFLDANGELHITGRSKEIIVLSSGKNIYPEEIEAHYLQSRWIKEICVLGLARPDEPASERLHAVVVPDFDLLRERKVLNTRELLRFEIENLSVQLPGHKRILSFEIWTAELPRTTTRKLKRFEIEQRAKQGAAAGAAREAHGQEQPLGAEEQAWTTRPEIARALELVREAAKSPAAVRPDANIELDLGLDSMERIELLTRLEQLFATRVPEEVAHGIYTVRELVEACLPQDAAPATSLPGGVRDRDAWGTLLEPPREDTAEGAAWTGLLRSRRLFAALLFVAMKLGYVLARVMFRFRVTGRENLPRQRPLLICPNHQSYLDPFLLVSALPWCVFRDVFIVGASEYFATPLMRRVAGWINLVPVDPDANLLRAMQAGAFGLRHGKVLVLFPEGERSIDGQVKKFKKGAAILAQHLRVPIVPVALDGAAEAWPRGRTPRWQNWLPWGGGRIQMHIGMPLPPPDPMPANLSVSQAEARYTAAAEHLRATVQQIWLPLRGPAPPK